MSGTATIAITVGVAVAVLVGFFIVYYLGNVANSIYDVKVGVRKDFDKKVKELHEWVEKDTKQRIGWMRDENKADSKRFKETMEGHLDETLGEMKKNIERLQADVVSLQKQVEDLQEGRGMRRGGSDMNARARPARDDSGGGNYQMSRLAVPDGEEAPDMAAVAKKDASDDTNADLPKPPQTAPTSTNSVQSKPTPPPPPTSKQPGGRASLEEKAKQKPKKKKRRNPDTFETFDRFSEDFKPGK